MKLEILVVVFCIAISSAKICLEQCSGNGVGDPMQNVDMVGCRRRRAYALQESLGRRVDFRCIGQNIPCTVRIGDTVNFTATFETAFPLRGLEQKVTWLQGWANIPWVGLDTDACKYLDGNCTRQPGGVLSLTYPVKILSFYPPGLYPIRWEFYANDPNGGSRKISLGCILTKIRIVK